MDNFNYYKEIIKRANVESVSSFIHSGGAPKDFDNIDIDNLSKRESLAYQKLEYELSKYMSVENLDKTITATNEYSSELCHIYFCLGMKASANLIYGLLNNSVDNT